MSHHSVPLTFGTVCSGIGAPEAAWLPLGWKAAFASEIEKFPRAVLAHHYPETPLHGDFKTIQACQYADIDVLCGGTPCQSFSVAGLRGGMADARGNLALEYLRLAQRLRPEWVVWENVPGVRSSNEGRDFGAFLTGLGQLGYGWAYRSFDAQYFGLAQRRERVFVVGYLGDWRRAAAVLFEPESLRGHPAPSREAGKGVAACLTFGAHPGGHNGQDDCKEGRLIAHTHTGNGFDASEDGTGRGTPLVALSVALRGREGGATAEVGDDLAFAIRASSGGGDKPHVMAFGHQNSASQGLSDNKHLSPTLDKSKTPAVQIRSAVRRLTPRECERIMGFPDDFTLIPWRRGTAADGPRYKALGNSMAVPCMRWIGKRIAMVHQSAVLDVAA